MVGRHDLKTSQDVYGISDNVLSVKKEKLFGPIVGAIQALDNNHEKLKDKIETQQAQITDLQAQIEVMLRIVEKLNTKIDETLPINLSEKRLQKIEETINDIIVTKYFK